MGDREVDVYEYLGRIEGVELRNPHLRVVEVHIPCRIPKQIWNVDEVESIGMSKMTGEPIPNMRRGIYGNFRLYEGPVEIHFNDGTKAFSL